MKIDNSIIAGAAFAILVLTTMFGVFAVFYAGNQQIISTVSTGTSPFTVASTTKVDNLNVDFVDGYSSSSFTNNRCRPFYSAASTSSTTFVNSGLGCTSCSGWLHTLKLYHTNGAGSGFTATAIIEIDGVNSSQFTQHDPLTGANQDENLMPTFVRYKSSVRVYLKSSSGFFGTPAQAGIGYCQEF